MNSVADLRARVEMQKNQMKQCHGNVLYAKETLRKAKEDNDNAIDLLTDFQYELAEALQREKKV